MNHRRREQLFELIRDCSCKLPEDVAEALRNARSREDSPVAISQLSAMLENARLAEERQLPLCQDTGSIIFHVHAPLQENPAEFRRLAEAAVIKASEEGLLRSNAVCPVSGKNSGNNLGNGSPQINWMPEEREDLLVKLMLKGGGSENTGRQYSLPDDKLNAGRDWDGIRKCIIDAVLLAQGKGCPPGAVSACIGGDRASGYAAAKAAFFREIGSVNPDPELAEWEESLYADCNNLGIGPMGLGGKTTTLAVFICARHRVPASFYVSVAQMCWAWRRQEIRIQI